MWNGTFILRKYVLQVLWTKGLKTYLSKFCHTLSAAIFVGNSCSTAVILFLSLSYMLISSSSFVVSLTFFCMRTLLIFVAKFTRHLLLRIFFKAATTSSMLFKFFLMRRFCDNRKCLILMFCSLISICGFGRRKLEQMALGCSELRTAFCSQYLSPTKDVSTRQANQNDWRFNFLTHSFIRRH